MSAPVIGRFIPLCRFTFDRRRNSAACACGNWRELGVMRLDRARSRRDWLEHHAGGRSDFRNS